VLWALSIVPGAARGRHRPGHHYSYAGMLGHALQSLFAPIGFGWQISIALVPGMAAREVAVGALGTVYALSAAGEEVADQLAPMLARGWSLATAFAARVVRLLAAMPVHAGGGQARDQLVALSAADGRLSVRLGVRRGLRHLPRGTHPHRRLTCSRNGGSGCGACTGCAGKPAPRSVAIIIKNDTKER
jgi:hypothetical protein